MRRMVIALMVVALLGAGAARPAWAEDDYLKQCGWGMAAVGTNLFYMPTKMVYALMGGMTGGIAYLLTVGNLDSAQSIWSPSIGGTWVVSAGMLRGRQPIMFSGESFEPKL